MLTVNLDRLEIKDGDVVLDLGCGEGRHMHGVFYAANTYVIGIDLNLEDVQRTEQSFTELTYYQEKPDSRFALAVSDALKLPFADNTFDKIICSEVLEHIVQYETALTEIDRILKPGGTLAVSVPRAWPEWICWKLSSDYPKTPGGHVRIFDAKALRTDIESLGLTFDRRHWAHGLHSPYWWLKCLFWKSQETSPLVQLYHRFLVWDLMKRPWLTQLLDKIATPIMGKSIVLYFSKKASA